MRKLRFLTSLGLSVFALGVLSSCEQHDPLPSVSIYQRVGENMESITIMNIPDEIKVGSFNSYGMYIHIVYSDGVEEDFPLRMASLPSEIRHVFNVPGDYTLTISFRGQEIEQTFHVVEGQKFFTLNFYSYQGDLLDTKVCNNGQALSSVLEVPDREDDEFYFYVPNGWEHDIEDGFEPYEDVDVYPLYKHIQKRYNGIGVVPRGTEEAFRVLSLTKPSSTSDSYDLYLHMGRLERFPLYATDKLEIATNTGEQTATFVAADLDPHSWSGILQLMYAEFLGITSLKEGLQISGDPTGLFTKASGEGIHDPSEYFVDVTNDIDLTTILPSMETQLENDVLPTNILPDSYREFLGSTSDSFTYSADGAEEGMTYYRAAIEGNVDVILHAQYKLFDDHIEFSQCNYYFQLDASKTYHVVQYDTSEAFAISGTPITTSYAELDHLFRSMEDYVL